MISSPQHPLVADFADRCKNARAAVYAGRNFVDARWENGRRLELRVDEPKPEVIRNPVNDF